MKLKETPELVVFPRTYFLFAERTGPFQESAPGAWASVHENYQKLSAAGQIAGSLALYQVVPQMVYRAGVVLKEAPKQIPDGFRYEDFAGGDYLRFLLIGPYSNLPAACARVFQLIEQAKIKVRENAFYGERYLNDMRDTPEDKLETEILVPVSAHKKAP